MGYPREDLHFTFERMTAFLQLFSTIGLKMNCDYGEHNTSPRSLSQYAAVMGLSAHQRKHADACQFRIISYKHVNGLVNAKHTNFQYSP